MSHASPEVGGDGGATIEGAVAVRPANAIPASPPAAQASGADEAEALPSPQASDEVAVVLAGAGARGAYEAGFIATLLPHLEPRPRIFVGTSAGAINAALLASVADRTAEDAGAEIIKRWKTIDRSKVMGPLWISLAKALLGYADALVLGRTCPDGLLDTKPLQETLGNAELLDWQRIHANISSGKVAVLSVAATEMGSGRTKLFYEHNLDYAGMQPPAPASLASSVSAQDTDEKQAIDYIPTTLTSEHVRASSAIPVFFPPVRLGEAFFIDGGVRLNAPLKPAVHFGAGGLIVIATDPLRYGQSDAASGSVSCTMLDQILEVMRATFADRMIEDILVLLDRNAAVLAARAAERKVKDLVREAPTLAPTISAELIVTDTYLPVIFGGPSEPERVGSVALRAIVEILRGPVPFFKNPNVCIFNWLMRVSSTSGPDMLSYFLFEPEFIASAIQAGVDDAEALLTRCREPKDLWRLLQSLPSGTSSRNGRGAAN
jgi:NTE family protein